MKLGMEEITVESLIRAMEENGYVADKEMATALYLALKLEKPLLIEGEPGCGKTEAAKVLSQVLSTDLIRLQCYEGLDSSHALYEWNYPRQIIAIRMLEKEMEKKELEREIFSEKYLLKRPLLRALLHEGPRPAVLLIDEIDRCLTGDTLVNTCKGLKRISDINVGDYIITFDPKNLKMVLGKVKKKIKLRSKDIIRIFAGGRIISTTPNHRFLVFSPKLGIKILKASELKVGDYLLIYKEIKIDKSKSNFRVNYGIRSLRREFYETLGYMLFNGIVDQDKLIIVSDDYDSIKHYSKKLYKILGSDTNVLKYSNGKWILEFKSHKLFKLIKENTNLFKDEKERSIPDFIYYLPEYKRIAFLRGIFEARGYMCKDYVVIDSSSDQLLIGIQMLLSSLGIDSYICKYDVEKFHGIYVLFVFEIKTFLKKLNLSSLVRERLLKEIVNEKLVKKQTNQILIENLDGGVMNELDNRYIDYKALANEIRRESSSLNELKECIDIKRLAKLNMSIGKVTKIERVKDEVDVYDITIDGRSPYFVANQIITHNSDEEFEGFLLEFLAEYQITIPEIGTVKANRNPVVIITSNRTREIGDGLRRRCLYLYVPYPPLEKEIKILKMKVKGLSDVLVKQVVDFANRIRDRDDIVKKPGVAETIDWARALLAIKAEKLDKQSVSLTLPALLKSHEDISRIDVDAELNKIV